MTSWPDALIVCVLFLTVGTVLIAWAYFDSK